VKLFPKHKVILQISLLSSSFAIPSIVMILVVRIKCVICLPINQKINKDKKLGAWRDWDEME
jgi:hypothetical protein